MDNNIITNDNKNTDRKRPGAGAVIAVSLLAMIFSLLTFLSLRYGETVTLIFCFVAATAFQTYLLYFVRNPFTLLIPCLASFVCMPNFLPSFICLCVLLVCSALFTIVLLNRAESFVFFMICAVVYSVLAGAAYVFIMINAFGSFSAGLEALTNMFSEMMNSISAEVSEDASSALAPLAEMAEAFVFMLPAIMCTVGIFAAWITKWFLSAAAAFSGLKKCLFLRVTGAPVGLAVIFVLLTLLGMLFSYASESVYFASLNVKSVLSVIFMGEGIREYIAVLRTNGRNGKKHIFVMIGAAIVMFFPSVLVTAAAYYGAYRTVFKKVHFTTITGK